MASTYHKITQKKQGGTSRAKFHVWAPKIRPPVRSLRKYPVITVFWDFLRVFKKVPAIKYDTPNWHRTLLLACPLKIQWQNLTTHIPGNSALWTRRCCLIDLQYTFQFRIPLHYFQKYFGYGVWINLDHYFLQPHNETHTGPVLVHARGRK